MKKWYIIFSICIVLVVIIVLAIVFKTTSDNKEDKTIEQMNKIIQKEKNASMTAHEEFQIFSTVTNIPIKYQDKMQKNKDSEVYQILLENDDNIKQFIYDFNIPDYAVQNLYNKLNDKTIIVATVSKYMVSKVEYKNLMLYYTMDSYKNPQIYYLHFYITHKGTTLQDVVMDLPLEKKYLKGYITNKSNDTITIEGGLEYIENAYGINPVENAKIHLSNELVIKNAENNSSMKLSDLQVGDQIETTGDFMDGWLKAYEINVVKKDDINKIKKELLEQEQIDGSIVKKEKGENGNTLIWFKTGKDNVSFNILVEVNNQTRKILGREDYILQENYDIMLNEITTLKLVKPSKPEHLVARVLEFIAD